MDRSRERKTLSCHLLCYHKIPTPFPLICGPDPPSKRTDTALCEEGGFAVPANFTGLTEEIQGRIEGKKKAPVWSEPDGALVRTGGDLLSHTVTRAVPSAQKSLTSVFGKGTGVTSSL